MHRAPFRQRTTERRAAFGCDWNTSNIINEFAGKPVRFGTIKDSILLTRNNSFIGIAERRRRLNKGLQYCVQVEGRTANHLKHVGGGGLLLQRFAQFVEQARVLDRYDSLVGEGLYQLAFQYMASHPIV
jgi:hypothetical protein